MSSGPSLLHARRWWALAVLSVIQLMVALDVTVINIALPWAQRDLHFSLADRQWPVTAYALAFGSLLLLGGRLVDLWGRRTSLLVGLVGFAGASVVGAMATSFSMLVSARAVQGGFGALLAPAALAALSTTFDEPVERATAFAIYGVVGGSGAAVGLVLGGALTQWSSWRWCLYINLVFAALALIGVIFFVSSNRGEHREPLDVAGTVLASAGLFLVVFGFGHAVTSSWANPVTWGSLTLGGVVLAGFVAWQARSAHPLLPLRILTNRTRAGSLIALFLTTISVFALTLFLAYYLQGTLGYSPLRTGIVFMPMVAALGLSAALASARLLAMVGPRPLVPVGMLLGMLGIVLFTKLTPHSNYLDHVLPGLVVTGLGLGLVFAPAIASATAGVRHADAGAASALVNTAQQIGSSIGVALLNTIAVTVTARALAHAPDSSLDSARLATLHGYAVAFWWAAGSFGVGAIVSFLLLESGAVDQGEPVDQISGQG